MTQPLLIHESAHPGLTMDGVEITEVHTAGQHYFKAVAQIGTIFGSEVDGQLTGYGHTREQALANLEKEQKALYESLWV